MWYSKRGDYRHLQKQNTPLFSVLKGFQLTIEIRRSPFSSCAPIINETLKTSLARRFRSVGGRV